MISVRLPDGIQLNFRHVVFDYNGTLAVDGVVTESTKQLLADLSKKVNVVILTADTYGSVREQLSDAAGINLHVVQSSVGGVEKREFVKGLGSDVAVVGNGVNDRPMFSVAKLAVCVIGMEGASVNTFASAHIIVNSPEDAIGLFLNPKRIIATLRS